jgi:hypothetical protein
MRSLYVVLYVTRLPNCETEFANPLTKLSCKTQF